MTHPPTHPSCKCLLNPNYGPGGVKPWGGWQRRDRALLPYQLESQTVSSKGLSHPVGRAPRWLLRTGTGRGRWFRENLKARPGDRDEFLSPSTLVREPAGVAVSIPCGTPMAVREVMPLGSQVSLGREPEGQPTLLISTHLSRGWGWEPEDSQADLPSPGPHRLGKFAVFVHARMAELQVKDLSLKLQGIPGHVFLLQLLHGQHAKHQFLLRARTE